MYRPEDVRPSLVKTLADLQVDYIDLYLMHWPIPFQPGEIKMPRNPDGTMNYGDTHYCDTWVAMETLVDEGLAKHIGLSNFNSQQVTDVSGKDLSGCVKLTLLCLHVGGEQVSCETSCLAM